MTELITLCLPYGGLAILGLTVLLLAWSNRKNITQINASQSGINVYFYHKDDEQHSK